MQPALADKVVIVTGSTTGIGQAIASVCIDQGARVLIHGRNADRGNQLQQRLGPNSSFHQDDLRDPNAAGRIVAAAIQAFGHLDGLVNNAAWVKRSDLESTTAELFDQVIAVNVRAPLLLIQAAAAYLEQRGGIVANIGSANASGGESHLLAYSISKGGLLTLSKNLADAMSARGIRFVHFNVGWVLTENEYEYKICDGMSEGWPQRLANHEIPSGKMTSPEEVARLVAFWMSDQSRPFSGTVVDLEQYPLTRTPPPVVRPDPP